MNDHINNQAITFDKKETNYPLEVNGPVTIRFIQFSINKGRVDHFCLKANINSQSKPLQTREFRVLLDRYQRQTDTAYFPQAGNPDEIINIEADSSIVLSVWPRKGFENESFDIAAVTYQTFPY